MSDTNTANGDDKRHDIGWHYDQARLRLDAILRPLDQTGWETPVAACPGWRVRDVIAHLVGVIEDAAAGVITGPPNEAQSAAEVERHQGDDPVALLDQWAELTPLLVAVANEQRIWPTAFDVLSHEHDIRAALGQPGARDHESIPVVAGLMFKNLEVPLALTVELDDDDYATGGNTGSSKPAIKLTTTAFDFFRLRLGRRTREEVLAMDWSEDPSEILDNLFHFGPTKVTVGD